MQSLVQSTQEAHDGTLYLHVYHHSGSSDFVHYEDDGQSYEYEQGNFHRRVIVYQGASHELILEAAEGNFTSTFERLKLILHGFEKEIGDTVSLNGQVLTVTDESLALLDPLPNFDPLGKPILQVVQQNKTISCPLVNQRMVFTW
jgi:alpha-glucosidase